MKRLTLGFLMVAVLVAGTSAASATTTGRTSGTAAGVSLMNMRAQPARGEVQVADNVVVTPQPGMPATQAAPVQPVAAAPVAVDPGPRKVVHAEVASSHNYMTTIAVSALMGGLVGGLVGGAVYYLGDRNHAVNIAYWAAGGVLVGTGVGIMQLVVQENRVSEATTLRKLPSDPAPTLRLALYRTRF